MHTCIAHYDILESICNICDLLHYLVHTNILCNYLWSSPVPPSAALTVIVYCSSPETLPIQSTTPREPLIRNLLMALSFAFLELLTAVIEYDTCPNIPVSASVACT